MRSKTVVTFFVTCSWNYLVDKHALQKSLKHKFLREQNMLHKLWTVMSAIFWTEMQYWQEYNSYWPFSIQNGQIWRPVFQVPVHQSIWNCNWNSEIFWNVIGEQLSKFYLKTSKATTKQLHFDKTRYDNPPKIFPKQSISEIKTFYKVVYTVRVNNFAEAHRALNIRISEILQF